MNNGFSIILCGDLDFEGMVIDVKYNMYKIASINYEKGVDQLEIEFFSNSEKMVFPLQEFLITLEEAKKLAIQCAKEDELRDNL